MNGTAEFSLAYNVSFHSKANGFTHNVIPPVGNNAVRVVPEEKGTARSNLNSEMSYVETKTVLDPGEIVKPIAPQSAKITYASPIQILEGRVLDVDPESGEMSVKLIPLMGPYGEHVGVIERQRVHEQDHELIKSGAVFYLSIYDRNERGTIENGQALRFRRRPSWTQKDVKQVEGIANIISENIVHRDLLPEG